MKHLYRFFVIVFIALTIYAIYAINLDAVEKADLDLLVILSAILSIAIVLYTLCNRKLKQRFTLFVFIISFITLNLGSFFLNINSNDYYGKYIFKSVSYISYRNEARGLITLLTAEATFFISYLIEEKRNKKKTSKDKIMKIAYGNMKRERIAYWSKVIMYFGLSFAFIKLILKNRYALHYGYVALYLASDAAYNSPLLDLFDGLYGVGFWGYMATLPDKKYFRLPVVLYIVFIILSILSGSRGFFVLEVLALIWYFMKKDISVANKKPVFSKKRIMLLGIAGFFVIVLLSKFGKTRVTGEYEAGSLIMSFLMFFKAQGGSGRIIALSLENEQEIKQYLTGLMPVLAPLKSFLLNNSISRIFTGGFLGQNAENLAIVGNLSAVLTYITNSKAYLNGGGVGSNYNAELLMSGGIGLVIVFNILLGCCFAWMDGLKSLRWGQYTFVIFAFKVFMYLPRSSTLDIIPQSVIIVLFIIVVTMLSKLKKTPQAIVVSLGENNPG